MEIVSKTYNGEYDTKLKKYENLGFLYYLIHNVVPIQNRRKADRLRSSFEVYKRTDRGYEMQVGNPVWMPEIGLGIGAETRMQERWEREWLYWYDRDGNRYPTDSEKVKRAEEIADRERFLREQERLQKEQALLETNRERFLREQERLQTEKLAAKLRELGIDPDCL